MNLNLIVPWPPKQLSPNARLHWSVVAAAKKKYKTACWALTLEAMAGARPFASVSNTKLRVHMVFYAPDRRHYDCDGLLSRMKSGLDGIAIALQVNDRRFRPSLDMSDDVGGMVKISITEMEG